MLVEEVLEKDVLDAGMLEMAALEKRDPGKQGCWKWGVLEKGCWKMVLENGMLE